MIAGGDCCLWTGADADAEDGNGADSIISPAVTVTTSTATLAAAANAIATTTSAPRRRIRHRRQQRSLANNNCNNNNNNNNIIIDKNRNSDMLSRLIPKDTADGISTAGNSSGSGSSTGCGGGGGGSAFSIASTSVSSSSSSSSSSLLSNPIRGACSLPLSSPAFSIFSSKSSPATSTTTTTTMGGMISNSLQQCQHATSIYVSQQQQQLPPPPHPQQQQCQSIISIPSPSPSSSSSSSSSHFLPSDFKPQTWLYAVHETVSSSSTTVRFASAGAAAALTAAIVIHPLALMGAVATAAAGAGATAMTMWAVGFFHDLDRGYQIWSSEEFGKLFWKDMEDNYRIGCNYTKGVDDDDDDEQDGNCIVMTEDNSRLLIQEDEVEVVQQQQQQQLFVAQQTPDQLGTSLGGETSRAALLDEEQKVEDKEGESAKGDTEDGDTTTAASSSSPERRTAPAAAAAASRSKKPSRSRGYSYGLQKIRSSPIPSIKPMVLRSRTRQSTTPSTIMAAGLDDDYTQSSSVLSTTPIKQSSPAKRIETTTSPTTTLSSSPSPPPSSIVNHHRSILDRYFPPLEICVIHSVKLPGLDSSSQFFNVFFADDAPYSMKDFQKRRGDVDIDYEPWEDCHHDGGGGGSSNNEELLFSFKEGDGSSVIEPLPRSTTKQRRLKFNTLTKSYFGPAYAKATKIQRVTQLHNDRYLIIENVTQLDDIPFSDRFRVIERWVLEVVDEGGESALSPATPTASESGTDHPKAASTSGKLCKLAVYAEVQMLKSCSWEPQIRKKASETFTDVATDWCKSAVVALAATEEQKRKRQRLEIESSGGKDVVENTICKGSSGGRPPRIPSPMTVVIDDGMSLPPAATAAIPSSFVRQRSQIFAEHKRNFDELDKRIAQGDLEWCSVEVTHSSHLEYYSSSNTTSSIGNSNNETNNTESIAMPSSAFATVLEYPAFDEYEMTPSIAGSSIDDDDKGDDTNNDGSCRKAAVMMRMKSRKLLRSLSSRRGGAYCKSSTQPIVR